MREFGRSRRVRAVYASTPAGHAACGGAHHGIAQAGYVNAIYDEFSDAPGAVEFADAVLERLGVEVEISEEELKRIPKTGPFISVSNHPFGGIDGIILIKILAERRPDFKVMANFLLQRIQPLAPNFIGVNPFENAREAKSNLGGLREALQHLKEGKQQLHVPLAGHVASGFADGQAAFRGRC